LYLRFEMDCGHVASEDAATLAVDCDGRCKTVCENRGISAKLLDLRGGCYKKRKHFRDVWHKSAYVDMYQ
jgi:hypothetical protein